jgi:hypothetical protein
MLKPKNSFFKLLVLAAAALVSITTMMTTPMISGTSIASATGPSS